MNDAAISMLCVAVIAGAMSTIFWAQDRHTPSSRALAVTFAVITVLMVMGVLQDGPSVSVLWRLVDVILEGIGLLSGLEWARRVAAASAKRFTTALNVLLRVSQGLMLLFSLMSIGYLFIAPEAATTDRAGFITARGYEFAIFAPILGSASLVALIAAALLLAARIDPAEAQRIRAMFLASPFFLLALIVSPRYVPLLIASGLDIFLLSAVGYLMTISRRAQFMGQFLSPELRHLAVQGEGSAAAEQRQITAVACDLRGFTGYAGKHASSDVTSLLEAYFERVGEAAATHGGTIKDHAGDGVLILVGAPLAVPDRFGSALAIAQAIREQVGTLMRERAPEIGIGVGVASGEATVGAVRGAGRLEYMAVGQVVNRAARLCDAAANNEILLDESTAQSLNGADRFEARDANQLKGLPEQRVYCVAG